MRQRRGELLRADFCVTCGELSAVVAPGTVEDGHISSKKAYRRCEVSVCMSTVYQCM